tara:strand:- start:475 stop:750 length:276 start_codon:yes stop_codon:yes gene_type:complete
VNHILVLAGNLPPYRGVYSRVFFNLLFMTVLSPLAVLTRKTQKGMSSWTFSDADGTYTASSSVGKVITCETVDELRVLYRKFRTWGFKLAA